MILRFTLMMTMMTVSLPLKADEAQCKSVLTKCDLAIKALEKENALQKQIIADEDTRSKDQTSELHREEFWRPIAYGAIVTAIIEGLILSFKK